MRANAAIEWTGAAWTPLAGCAKIGPGRRHRKVV